MLKERSLVLFQGDSITDDDRQSGTNDGLGRGFPFIINNILKAERPDITVLNRGVSGDRSRDLVARWTEDCVALKPDHVTILIGVNDTWRGFDRNDPTTAEQFESNLRAVLERTVDETGAEIVLMMPFIVLGVQASSDVMLPDLEGKRAAVRKLAGEFGATLIDLQQVFDKAIADGIKPSALSADGVHPTDDCGHELIAKTWINTVL